LICGPSATSSDQFFEELRVDAALHQYPTGGHADLPLMQVHAPGGIGDGQIQIGIIEHHQRILATQLQRHFFQMPAGQFTDPVSGRGGTGKLDHCHIRISGQRRRRRAIARQ
jgi:hypothetical protein